MTAKDADHWFEAHHVGADDTHDNPQYEAFDRHVGQCMHLSMTPTPFPVECQLPYRIVSKAQHWIESDNDKPFLLWLSFRSRIIRIRFPSHTFRSSGRRNFHRCELLPRTWPPRGLLIVGAVNRLKRLFPTIRKLSIAPAPIITACSA